MAFERLLRDLAPEHDAEFQPTQRWLARIGAGERGDVAILTKEAAAELAAAGVLAPGTDLARSFVGVAVRAGAPPPDISTPAAFVDTLLRARSVAMSQAGASGLFMAGLLDRLGIAGPVRAKATILSSGYTASPVATGEVELAIQQVSELMMVDGVTVAGRIPAELGGQSIFTAALFRDAPDAAQRLVDTLADPARADLYARHGLEQVGKGPSTQA